MNILQNLWNTHFIAARGKMIYKMTKKKYLNAICGGEWKMWRDFKHPYSTKLHETRMPWGVAGWGHQRLFFITHTIVWNTRPWRNMHIDIRYSFLIIYSINNEIKKIKHYFAIYKISNLSIRILFLIFYLIKNKLYLHLLIMIVSIQNVTSHWIARNFFKTTECIIC